MSEAVSEQEDALPVVARSKQGNWGMWAFAIAIVLGGFWLFSIMSANRAALTAPRTTAVAPEAGSRITSPPPLALPDQMLAARETLRPRRTLPATNASPTPVVARTAPPTFIPAPAVRPFPLPPAPMPETLVPPAPSVVFDSAFPANGTQQTESEGAVERITAGRLTNPSLTIPQGTIIPAVLETALDSTRAGGVRALVQRDIYGFDGTRVLVNRGSRLYGEYEAALAQGENRALIRWTRLIRPDGVTIALDSPSSDPLGRAGVKGDVDSKFFQRFGGAILQSVLDIGVGIATQKATDGVVVALPGSTQNIQVQNPQQIRPTLKVRHGTSVSVFVARDLDFSTVDR